MTPDLWKERGSLPRINKPAAGITIAAVALLSGASCVMTPILAFVFAAAATAMQALLFILNRSLIDFITLPMSYAVGLFLLRAVGGAWLPIDALVGFIYIAPAIMVAAAVYLRYNCSRASVMAAIAVGAVVVAGAAAAIAITGTSPASIIANAQDAIKEWLALITVKTTEGEQQLFTEESINMLSAYVAYISPSAVALLFMAFGLVTAKMLHALIRLFKVPDIIPDKWLVTTNLAVCIIYCSAAIISFLFSVTPNMQIAYYSILNVLVVFAPGPIIVGIRTTLDRLNKYGSPGMRIVFALLIAGFIYLTTTIAFSLFAFIGSLATFREAWQKNRPDADE